MLKSLFATTVNCNSNSIRISECLKPYMFYETPFRHAVISELFSKDLFSALSGSIENYLSQANNIARLNRTWSTNSMIASKKGKDPALTFKVHQFYKLGISPFLGHLLLRSFSSVIPSLLQTYNCKRLSSSYYPQAFFNFTPPNFSFGIHDDTPAKSWTLAYNIYPTANKGTMLYTPNKELSRVCDWNLNTGVAFAPESKVSWHSYENPSSTEYRVNLIINIMRRDSFAIG